MTFVLNGESKGNGSQHGGKDVCTCSWCACGDVLMTVRTLFTNQHRSKIDKNPNILRNIVEVMEDGILIKF